TVAGDIICLTTDGGVALSWPYNDGLVDGFHIYRRTADSEAVRLTDEMLTGDSGRIEYVDPGYGIAIVTVLSYSFSLISDGVETMSGKWQSVTFRGSVPTQFALRNNYPNPFNPLTNIEFDLPKAGQVSLFIYDVSGRLVKTLINEALPAAKHLVQWDGTDGSSRRVASGVYYYRLDTGNDAATKRMMLVK
ncbi:MAG: T9SS type A sorting domain-containing protein, partial [bacterium]